MNKKQRRRLNLIETMAMEAAGTALRLSNWFDDWKFKVRQNANRITALEASESNNVQFHSDMAATMEEFEDRLIAIEEYAMRVKGESCTKNMES
jgi:hypothetical protein